MPKSTPSRSLRLENKADAIYPVATPFHNTDAKILLINRDEEGVEVIIGNIPKPKGYDTDRNYPGSLENEESMRAHATAEWIVMETTEILSEYDWETSDAVTRNPNHHLRDIYFTCERDEVNNAVMAAKRFLMELEEKSVQHAEEFDRHHHSPREELS